MNQQTIISKDIKHINVELIENDNWYNSIPVKEELYKLGMHLRGKLLSEMNMSDIKYNCRILHITKGPKIPLEWIDDDEKISIKEENTIALKNLIGYKKIYLNRRGPAITIEIMTPDVKHDYKYHMTIICFGEDNKAERPRDWNYAKTAINILKPEFSKFLGDIVPIYNLYTNKVLL